MSYSSERTLSQSSSCSEENFWVKFGFKWLRFLLLHRLFILSGTLHPSDCEGLLNLSLFLLITTFHWGYKLHICLVYFQVTVPIYSTSLTWPNTAWATADGGFFFLLVKPSAVTGECGGGWPQTSVCQHNVTHVSHRVNIIFKACRLQHVIRLRPEKNKWNARQTSCIPEPIPQSTITSLNSSTLDGGARAHPVVLAALPAHAAQSVFLVAMATGKHCTHA